jgi:hypothetical protein
VVQAITPAEVLQLEWCGCGQSTQLWESGGGHFAIAAYLAEVQKYWKNGTIGSWTSFEVQGKMSVCST